MARLREFLESDPVHPVAEYAADDWVAARLAQAGVQFERWPVQALAAGDSATVLASYADAIHQVQQQFGYSTVDVVSLTPDHPDRIALREKFLFEHTHSADEVRYFVAGGGLFNLHVADRVLEIRAEAGDFLRLPAGIKHWFDMGTTPHFIAIRFFHDASGWVAAPTGAKLAADFPSYVAHAAPSAKVA
jgi:1,2-dihydroxy-3-keto-5-methylthiopentene dioxygenase